MKEKNGFKGKVTLEIWSFKKWGAKKYKFK